MTTRTPTGRAIEVPDLVGVKAGQAIQELRELGLMPIAWSAAVEEVSAVGFVVGLDPAVQEHADDSLTGRAETPAQPPSSGPEICDRRPLSPAELRNGSTQLQEDGRPARRS